MAHPARVKSKGLNGVPHLPFQEFAVPSLEAFLSVLKKAKIRDSEIEVSSSVESQHTICSKPLVNVLVMTAKGSVPPSTGTWPPCTSTVQGVGPQSEFSEKAENRFFSASNRISLIIPVYHIRVK